ncbi:hypothetical protein NA57DRAFT_81950 [Rhizodiscina lignyota]|uniref:Uncharacterized protein n=1 Tax=Rhizodiscina lignyota TaxID=1504668 RepID=A0A9P4M301_9PEZI|nr:hypothetical protein NA57DRAFT_81950 [Rhizodiscina lignyota]
MSQNRNPKGLQIETTPEDYETASTSSSLDDPISKEAWETLERCSRTVSALRDSIATLDVTCRIAEALLILPYKTKKSIKLMQSAATQTESLGCPPLQAFCADLRAEIETRHELAKNSEEPNLDTARELQWNAYMFRWNYRHRYQETDRWRYISRRIDSLRNKLMLDTPDMKRRLRNPETPKDDRSRFDGVKTLGFPSSLNGVYCSLSNHLFPDQRVHNTPTTATTAIVPDSPPDITDEEALERVHAGELDDQMNGDTATPIYWGAALNPDLAESPPLTSPSSEDSYRDEDAGPATSTYDSNEDTPFDFQASERDASR